MSLCATGLFDNKEEWFESTFKQDQCVLLSDQQFSVIIKMNSDHYHIFCHLKPVFYVLILQLNVTGNTTLRLLNSLGFTKKEVFIQT